MSDTLKKIHQQLRNSLLFVFLRFIKYDVILPSLRKAKKSAIILFVKKIVLFTIFRLRVRHIYGPKKIDYGLHELIVVCLVRDGDPYIQSFIEHYFALAVKHSV